MAPTRDEARRRLICGLEQTAAFGVTTNQAFLPPACAIPPSPRARRPRPSSASIATNCWRRVRTTARGSGAGGAAALCHRSPCAAVAQRTIAGGDVSASAADRARSWHARSRNRARARRRLSSPVVDGREHRFEIDELGGDTHPLPHRRRDGIGEGFCATATGFISCTAASRIAVRDLTLAAPASAAADGGDGKVRAAMNGRVVAVLVKPGERVAAGQPVMTLEAMKMEHVHHGRHRGHGFGDRCRRRRAGDDGEDRGGDRRRLPLSSRASVARPGNA